MNDLSILSDVQEFINPKILPYIWFMDGERKNIDIADTELFMRSVGVQVDFDISVSEPSAIFQSCIVDLSETEKLPYYPTYRKLSPSQRGSYYRFLSDPFRPAKDVGCLFLFYYGLERHLFNNNKSVADLIIRLRELNRNRSFLKYSADALVCTSILTGDGFYAEKLLNSDVTGLSDNLKRLTSKPMLCKKIKPYANMSLRYETVTVPV